MLRTHDLVERYHMTHDLLHQAADEVEATGEQLTDPATRTRLSTLADQLRAQADREAPPALGALARVQHALREIAADTDDEEVHARLEYAIEQLVSFLETLDDRGMTQHGWDQHTDPNDAA